MVFIEQEGKIGHRWWLWVFLSEDSVVFRLDPSRSHDVPEGHFAADACLVLMVDRYSGYKAMAQVKLGNVILAFCWAHVRRDFVEVGKGWDGIETVGLGLAPAHPRGVPSPTAASGMQARQHEFHAADAAMRQSLGRMQRQAAAELADPQTPRTLPQGPGQSSRALVRA